MSQYCDPSDVKAMAIRAEALAGYTDPQIAEFCKDVSSLEVDVYIRSRYLQDGPLVSWGRDLRVATARITALAVLTQRGFDPENPADAAIELAAKKAHDVLKDVQNGRGALDVQMTSPATSTMPRVYSQPKRNW